jgi:hypothetical protein
MTKRIHAPSGYVILGRGGWYYPAQVLGPEQYGLLYNPHTHQPAKRCTSIEAAGICLQGVEIAIGQ